MIEFCSTKRMLIGILILGGLTLLDLIIESQWTSKSKAYPSTFEKISSAGNYSVDKELCYLTEYAVVVGKCEPCSGTIRQDWIHMQGELFLIFGESFKLDLTIIMGCIVLNNITHNNSAFSVFIMLLADFEIVSGISKVCNKTHRYKLAVKCVQSNIIVFKSCDKVEWLEDRKFFAFEVFMFSIGLVSSVCAIYRQKALDSSMMRRVQNQLANCV